jgi:hypothetical protein
MGIREYTNHECDENRLHGTPVVRRYDQSEQSLLDGLADALAQFTGSVTVLPSGLMTNDSERQLRRAVVSPAELKRREERMQRRCKTGCDSPVRYARLMLCHKCYMRQIGKPNVKN